jgi:hypothetical protein
MHPVRFGCRQKRPVKPVRITRNGKHETQNEAVYRPIGPNTLSITSAKKKRRMTTATWAQTFGRRRLSTGYAQ